MTDWRQEYEDAITERNNLAAEVLQLRAVNELMRAVAQKTEWVEDSEDNEPYCWVCQNYKKYGHDADCKLKQALDAARPQTSKLATGT